MGMPTCKACKGKGDNDPFSKDFCIFCYPSIPIPTTQKKKVTITQSNKECDSCLGSGLNEDGDDECMICGGAGVVPAVVDKYFKTEHLNTWTHEYAGIVNHSEFEITDKSGATLQDIQNLKGGFKSDISILDETHVLVSPFQKPVVKVSHNLPSAWVATCLHPDCASVNDAGQIIREHRDFSHDDAGKAAAVDMIVHHGHVCIGHNGEIQERMQIYKSDYKVSPEQQEIIDKFYSVPQKWVLGLETDEKPKECKHGVPNDIACKQCYCDQTYKPGPGDQCEHGWWFKKPGTGIKVKPTCKSCIDQSKQAKKKFNEIMEAIFLKTEVASCKTHGHPHQAGNCILCSPNYVLVPSCVCHGGPVTHCKNWVEK